MRVLFSWNSGRVDIELYETLTARELATVVSFEASASTRGDEV